mmetsp:Transcript_27196/g.72754  ORF Transcript_27196/g.72754 Transcript_27196/m.72754 type:complete len:226 (+) Transcript_27196:564-1241(+)
MDSSADRRRSIHLLFSSLYSGVRAGSRQAGVATVPTSGSSSGPNHSFLARQRSCAVSLPSSFWGLDLWVRSFTLGKVIIIGISFAGTPSGSFMYLRTPSKIDKPCPAGSSSMFVHSNFRSAAQPLIPMLAMMNPSPWPSLSSSGLGNAVPLQRRAVFRHPHAETTQHFAISVAAPASFVVSTPTALPLLSSTRTRATGARTKTLPPLSSIACTSAAAISPVPCSG